MEWVEGDKIDALTGRFQTGELDFHQIMETLTEIYLRMLLVDGFMHADPHPGNILVDPEGRLVFLDLGMVIRFCPATRDQIIRVALYAGCDNIDVMINGIYVHMIINTMTARYD